MLTSLLLLALHAPAPLPKAPPPAPRICAEALLGDWDCQWGTTKCVMHFRKDGVYGCNFLGTDWYGSWELRGTTLFVKERIYDSDGPGVSWSVELTGPREGEIGPPTHWRGAFSLHKRGTLILGPSL